MRWRGNDGGVGDEKEYSGFALQLDGIRSYRWMAPRRLRVQVSCYIRHVCCWDYNHPRLHRQPPNTGTPDSAANQHRRCPINELLLSMRPSILHDLVSFLFYASIPAAPPRSDAPLITVERSPTGIARGKSTEASIMAMKIHQPAMHVTKEQAPPA